ncbi:MAG: hypothetical protein EOP04_31925 [Proteobacteria bacterium]|nr:MAG: hypothetical protein EOP04_31925 [Pseudomonadota bacterium]
MNKILIVILSDPKSGTEESTARAFNALTTAYDLKERKEDVRIVFQGTGTRWPSVLYDPNHRLHELFELVTDRVDGACGSCADVFGAANEVKDAGHKLIRELKVPGTDGVTSLGKYLKDGYQIITF